MPLVDLTHHPVKPTEFGRWQQLNGPLVCEPGEAFDIEHDEADTGHQEVYVVVSGRAEFAIGDQRIEAAPGTVVSAPDPSQTRSYRALAADTRIVCIGAPVVAQGAYGAWIDEAATSA
jgi:mannose-6-phosphate isomerase-like protein (cupin superfamily)